VTLLTEAELEAIRKHAEADYPAEACGVLLVRPGAVPGATEERRLRPCRNIQDELHAKDPGRFPRTARTAYYIAHEDLLEIGRREGEGFEVRVIYHSHVDAGAYFSETDRRNAMMGDEPCYPGATYVVTSVMSGRVDAMAAFRWDPARREFAGVEMSEEATR
jgi:proteasome lid subunit RPN8/RPN11